MTHEEMKNLNPGAFIKVTIKRDKRMFLKPNEVYEDTRVYRVLEKKEVQPNYFLITIQHESTFDNEPMELDQVWFCGVDGIGNKTRKIEIIGGKMLFEKATREAWRFEYKGLITVEDLWKLPKAALKVIFDAEALKAAKKTGLETLGETKETKEEALAKEKMELIRHIYEVKEKEELERLDAKKEKEKKDRVRELIAKKKDAALENLSVEELEKLL